MWVCVWWNWFLHDITTMWQLSELFEHVIFSYHTECLNHSSLHSLGAPVVARSIFYFMGVFELLKMTYIEFGLGYNKCFTTRPSLMSGRILTHNITDAFQWRLGATCLKIFGGCKYCYWTYIYHWVYFFDTNTGLTNHM